MLPTMRQTILSKGLVKTGLVAYYDFVQGPDGQVLYDRSGNNNHGQLGATTGAEASDPTWTAQGLTFDGQDQIVIPYGNGLNPLVSDLDIFMSCLTTVNSTTNVPFGSMNGTNQRVSVYKADEASPWDIGMQASGAASVGNVITPGNTPVILNLSMSKGVAELYVNNVFARTKAYTSFVLASNIYFGSKGDAGIYFLTGKEFSAAIYSRKLTPNERRQVYNFLKGKLAQKGAPIP